MTAVETDQLAPSLRDYQPARVALRDAWFPIAHLARVRRRPVRRALHGEPVFLWRDGGRGGRLRVTEDSPRDIERDRRRGSAFTGGTGDWPVVERHGYAWVWYGDPDAAIPDLVPNVPHIPVEGMPLLMQGSVVFDCSYELVCENLLDLTHADFLHSALTGDALAEDDEIFVESTSETVTMTRIAHGRNVPRAQKPFVKGATSQDIELVTLVHVRSGVCLLHGNFQPGPSIRMLHPVNPESPTRCRTPVTYNPQHCSTVVQRLFPATSHIVGRQDNWAIRPQNERYLADGHQKDLSSRFDRAALRYRKVYQQLVARQQQGDMSYLADGDPSRDVADDLGLFTRGTGS